MTQSLWPDRLSKALKKVVGERVRDEIITDWDDNAKSEDKADWTRQTLDKLDALIPDKKTRIDVLSRCSCACFEEDKIAPLRELYRKSGDIDKLLDVMYKNPFYVRPRREDNKIFFTKMPFDAEAHAKASSPEERCRTYCHCEWARAATVKMSLTHCYCGAGWYKQIMEGILEHPVEIDISKSVLQGDDVCEIVVRF
ncbi:MAG: hypothetical protein KOO62_02315 [candidate division Zixibacteria bacterium]|nr:hypothetical protein [candidate division Zixibacteria bacterium]